MTTIPLTKFKSWFLIVILCVKISKTIESKTDRSIPHHSSAPACLQISFMITNTSHKIKYFTQKTYKQFLRLSNIWSIFLGSLSMVSSSSAVGSVEKSNAPFQCFP
jgi:hypothetical protein